ncbi:MAG: hypothetical protein QOE44_979, partial [Solirubrobacteraceae bacterium]|nr:hypothetical protein [Solirubrobacteraceae bacterium]
MRLSQGGIHGRILGFIAVLVLAVPAAAAGAGPARGVRDACPAVPARQARCLTEILTADAGGVTPLVTAAPAGLGPADLWSAYALGTAGAAPTGGTGQTIGIVDAYDDPNAEADLGHYRSTYGLPACTTANGCLRRVDQAGGTSYPRADAGWASEVSLDLDMASAICPACKIVLVEAKSSFLSDLGAAVDRAVALGATQVSNSYGGSEYSSEASDQADYNHPGVDITVSSGDDGYGVQFPAASRFVQAVGGTSLTRSTSAARGWTESVWSGAGSGCSAYVPKPTWQLDTGCANRSVADVSAVADPRTGVAVYDTYQTGGTWAIYGGTSASAPIVAGVDALAGGRAGTATPYGSFPYAHPAAFFDVKSGTNGTCGGSYLCQATTGYDGPTGLGTPAGTGTDGPPAGPTVTSVTLSPASVVGGAPTTATVSLSGAAPTGGATVALTTSSPTAGVPPGVGVAAGATSATFVVTTIAIGAAAQATITATYGASAKSAVLSVTPTPPTAAYTPSTYTPAVGQTVSFNGSASSARAPGATIAAYRWVWGDGTPDGSGPTPTHVFTAPTTGPRSVGLYVTDSLGTVGAVGHGITVGPPPPAAAFSPSTYTPVVGQTVSFNGSASTATAPGAPIVSYRWVWGDGTPDGSGPTATHAFVAPVKLSVGLYVTDSLGSVGAEGHTITVSPLGAPPPTAAYTPSTYTPAVGQTVSFNGSASTATAPGATITGYRWVWGDGTPDGSGPTATHAFAAPGKVSVGLYVTDTNGTTAAVGHGITVGPPPPTVV